MSDDLREQMKAARKFVDDQESFAKEIDPVDSDLAMRVRNYRVPDKERKGRAARDRPMGKSADVKAAIIKAFLMREHNLSSDDVDRISLSKDTPIMDDGKALVREMIKAKTFQDHMDYLLRKMRKNDD